MRRLVEHLRFEREPSAVETGLLAGGLAATSIFATRLVSDDLAVYLFSVSHGF